MAPPYHWITDPSHGWLIVSSQDLEASGFAPSRASFTDPSRQVVYLEQDCDAPGYLAAIGVARETARRWPVRVVQSFDRGLPRWDRKADAA